MPRFLLDPTATFLNHGSFGATPRELLAVQSALRAEMEHQPVDFLVRQLPARLAAARERLGALLGARADDLAFVPNATAGVAAVLGSVELAPGDEILTTNHSYNAVTQAIRRRARGVGARVVTARLPWPTPHPDALEAAVVQAITDRTRLLVIDQVTSPTALVLPAERIVAAARERGVLTLVDGAHAAGQLSVDLRALDADWWVGNLHKWLCAPKGAALLCTREHHQARTQPTIPSHGNGLGYREEFDWPGTFDPTAWLTAPAAADLHDAMGGEQLRADHHALVQRGREEIADAIGAPLPHPDDPALYAAMAALPLGLPADRALSVNQTLWAHHRIEAPVSPFEGQAVLRISGFAAYNTPADYTRLAQVLPKVLTELR